MRAKVDKNASVITEVVEDKIEDQKVPMLITAEALKIMKTERVTINQLFILLAMDSNFISLLDIFDGNSSEFKLQDYQLLEFHGFLEDTGTTKLYELTQKGKDFVQQIRPLMELNDEEKENEAAFKQMCVDYRLLFPNIKLPSGKYARSNIVEIEKKMKNWIKTYKPVLKKEGFKLTNEDILKVTKDYIARFAKDNYRFMVTSSYFIQKNEKSALADEIQAMKDGINAAPKSNIVTM